MSKISCQLTKWKRRLSKDSRKDLFSEIVVRNLDLNDHDNDCTSAILSIEDLAFHIATYLVPKRNPSSLQEMLSNPMFVSRRWYRSFSLVRAQMRYDYLIKQLSVHNESQWLYHKIVYLPSTDAGCRSVPPEGCLRIFRSSVNETCKEALHDYRQNRNNDENRDDRNDSRPEYFYKAYRETAPMYLQLVLPKALSWTDGSQVNVINEIEYDEKPRLISQYWATIDDINGMVHSTGGNISKEGRLDLGYHEIVSVRDCRNANLNPRPPLNRQGEDTTSMLQACNAKAFDAPRWVRFAHVIGEDRCTMFIHKSLLPMIGSRPTGNTWQPQRAST